MSMKKSHDTKCHLIVIKNNINEISPVFKVKGVGTNQWV